MPVIDKSLSLVYHLSNVIVYFTDTINEFTRHHETSTK